MAEYKNIKGFTVQTLSTDTVANQFVGGAWASGGDLNTARYRGVGTGTQTAGLVAGGYNTVADTEQYNGTAWTEVANLNEGRDQGGANVGTYSATLYMSGADNSPSWPNEKTSVEQWNGSAWTEITDVNTARRNTMGAGTVTAAIMGAGPGATTPSVKTESWNGSAWTEVNDFNSNHAYLGSAGTSSTAALGVSGTAGPPGVTANVESWDGTNWTEISNLNVGREGINASGSYTEAIAHGGDNGSPSYVTSTEHYDGTSWTEIADLSTGRGYWGGSGGGSSGTASATFAAGGYTSTVQSATEEFTAPSDFVQQNIGQLYFNSTTNTFKETITDMAGATWASAPSLNTSTRYFCGGAGSTTASLICGGQNPVTNNTELFNGSSWTEVNEMNAAKVYHSVTGLSTAAMAVGGSPAPSFGTNNEQWDGTNWTESTESNDSTNDRSQCGITTAALFFGNSNNYTELWNGSAFTEGANMNNARGNLAGGGIQTLAIGANGYKAPLGSDEVELWDGSTWTETTESNTSRQSVRGAGTQTAFIMSMGNRPGGAPSLPGNATSRYTEFWNGTSWTELNDMSTARYAGASSQGPASSSTSALYSGGYTGTAYSGASEEWTADVANKTITAS